MLMSALVKKTNPLSEIKEKDIQSQNKYLRITHQTVIIIFPFITFLSTH